MPYLFAKLLTFLLLFLRAASFFDVNMSEASLNSVLNSGSMNGYFTRDEFYSQLNAIRADRANSRFISQDVVFGRTYQDRELTGFYITNDTSQLEHQLSKKNILLINAVHHSREPLTLTMILLMARELLKMARRPAHSRIKELLRDNVVFFIPIVNLDSYVFINQHFFGQGAGPIRMIRKNRHIDARCNEISGGVDLNRNYDFQFGANESGSSSDPCQEDYRGERPFSEPETASIKSYVDQTANIVSAVNIHTYGNSWIYPFNYVSDKSDHLLLVKKRLFYDFYKEFEGEIAGKRIKALFGNAAFALDYPTNGEAGDWFTGKKNILNIDVELGDTDPASEQFYPPKRIIPHIVRYNWVVMKEFFYKHIIELSHRIVISNGEVVFDIMNNGISSLIDFEAEVKPDLAAGSGGYNLFYSLKELPGSFEDRMPVLDNKIAATLKGRNILAVHVIFKRKADVKLLNGLHVLIKRNADFMKYQNQSYYFKIQRKGKAA